MRYQVNSVHDVLITLSENEKSNHDITHEVITLADQLKDLNFIVSLTVWYDMLFKINVANKMLQAKNMDIAECTRVFFLENYTEVGFKQIYHIG